MNFREYEAAVKARTAELLRDVIEQSAAVKSGPALSDIEQHAHMIETVIQRLEALHTAMGVGSGQEYDPVEAAANWDVATDLIDSISQVMTEESRRKIRRKAAEN